MKNTRVIIPAAGKGTRLHAEKGDLPKVMFSCGGKPLLENVLSSVSFISPEDTYIVVGYKKDAVISYFGDSYNYVEQTEQLGTGHAVMVCADAFRDFDGTVLVTFGDMPLFRTEDMKKMCEQNAAHRAACTLMTAENPSLESWARIVRDDRGDFSAIVEGKDCTPEQEKIKELFAGVLVFDSKALFETLPEVRTNNAQKEYYLTEVPELMARKGLKVETYHISDGDDLRGVNTPEDIRECERVLLSRQKNGIKAGFARSDINPPLGHGISGYFVPRYVDGYLDPLYLSVLALGDGENTVLLVSSDTTSIPSSIADSLRRTAAEAAGIDEDAVFISATHTHTAPFLDAHEECAPADLPPEPVEEYVRFYKKQLASAAKAAVDGMTPARIGYASTHVSGLSFVRTYRMKDGTIRTNPGFNNPDVVEPVGMCDDEVGVVRIDTDGGDTMILVNYANHADTTGGTKISADWPGAMRRELEDRFPAAKCLFFNGMEGDINHINVFPDEDYLSRLTMDFDDVPRGTKHTEYMGKVMADAVLSVLDKVSYSENSRISYARRIISVPTNMPLPDELPEAHRIMDLHNAGRDSELGYEGMMLTTVIADANRKCRLESGPAEIKMPVSVITFCDISMIGVPGEPFNEIGVKLKKYDGVRAVLPCSLTNGDIGYFPMKSSYERGGYEARSSMFRAGVGEIIIKEGLSLLKET